MNNSSPVKLTPGTLNKICARPVLISWAMGACALDAAIISFLSKEVSLSVIISDTQAVLFLTLALVPATLLGYFLGMFTCWPLLRVVCSRFNGAPLKTGDHVMILSGPHKGSTAVVYEIMTGQGGRVLARLDLGPERAKTFKDIFEEYSVFKIKIEL